MRILGGSCLGPIRKLAAPAPCARTLWQSSRVDPAPRAGMPRGRNARLETYKVPLPHLCIPDNNRLMRLFGGQLGLHQPAGLKVTLGSASGEPGDSAELGRRRSVLVPRRQDAPAPCQRGDDGAKSSRAASALSTLIRRAICCMKLGSVASGLTRILSTPGIEAASRIR
jgi:hypothetical protein